MPYGFQSRYLPLIMRKHGKSITDIGLFKLLLLPWIFKVFIAAFIVDEYKTKKFWLLFSMLILAFGSFIGALTDEFSYLAYIIFLLNWASATQDICVDWFAMNTLKKEDLGVGNTIQVVGFKVGTLFRLESFFIRYLIVVNFEEILTLILKWWPIGLSYGSHKCISNFFHIGMCIFD